MPLTKPWYLGVANIRGNLYSIIDFGAFLGHDTEPSAPGTAPARLVLFGPRVGELRAGLVVHRVLGLRNLAELVRGDAASGRAGMVRRALDRSRGRHLAGNRSGAARTGPGFSSSRRVEAQLTIRMTHA